ncbi:MAG: hypothetical protein IKY76_03165 [Alistipes sp.]|nr:hypothetical protein [Alistipes sp.]
MVGEVNKIIFNMLISGQGAYLPEIGTLYIERQGARKIASNKLMNPRNIVRFTSQVQATSLVEEIAKIANCEVAQAQDIYDRWRAKTQVGNSVTIEGVGKLTDKSFAVESGFNKTINPQGVKTIIVRRHKSHAWLFILSGVCIVVALGIFAFLLWGDAPKTIVTAPAVTEQPAPAEVVAEPTDSLSAVEGTTSTAESTEPAEVVEPTPTSREYAHYVVMGIFSEEANATRAAEQVKSKIVDADCVIRPFKNKHMVTVFGSDSRAECNTFAKSYLDIYPDLWIYDNK